MSTGTIPVLPHYILHDLNGKSRTRRRLPWQATEIILEIICLRKNVTLYMVITQEVRVICKGSREDKLSGSNSPTVWLSIWAAYCWKRCNKFCINSLSFCVTYFHTHLYSPYSVVKLCTTMQHTCHVVNKTSHFSVIYLSWGSVIFTKMSSVTFKYNAKVQNENSVIYCRKWVNKNMKTQNHN